MSNYWHFECMDHTPPLASVDEFTQHTDDHNFRHAEHLVSIRPVAAWEDNSRMTVDSYFDGNARRFLAGHPSCAIELVSETGERRTTPAPPTPSSTSKPPAAART